MFSIAYWRGYVGKTTYHGTMNMRLASLFGVLAFACGYMAADTESTIAKVVCAVACVTFLSLAVVYTFPFIVRVVKRPDGRITWLAMPFLGPYFFANNLLLRSVRACSNERPFDEIVPGLYLGSRLLPSDKAAPFAAGAVLDLTWEFAEVPFLREDNDYRCIPIIDTGAPTPGQLKDGATWIAERLAVGPVYVHCASGHGRSATFMAAYFLRSGRVISVEEAIHMLLAKRPGVALNHAQRASLSSLE